MSWMKDQAEKAKSIQVTGEDKLKAADKLPSGSRTAPGQFMQLQATADRQRLEIAQLKDQLGNVSRLNRPISKMHEKPGYRRKLTHEQYSELKANLSKFPLSSPVVLEVRPDGEWDINSGSNRVAIYRDLGREEIDSIISVTDPALSRKLAVFANLFAPSLPDFEKYRNFQELQLEADALSRQELALAAGLSESHVSRIFAFDGLPEEAKVALAERPERLGADAAAQLSRAAQEGRSDKVIEAVRRLIAEDGFLQKDAIRSSQPEKPKPAPVSPALTVKLGRKKYCEITTRNGVIGVKLNAEIERVDEWADEIRNFIETKLAERST